MKNVKLISTSSFLGIFIVYPVIIKIKRNIKPKNEQNLFCVVGGLPLPHPRIYPMVVETSEGAH